MSEKPDSEEFDEDDADEAVENDDPQLERLLKTFDFQKRRSGPKPGEPAWRRLEKYMEQKRTAEHGPGIKSPPPLSILHSTDSQAFAQ